MFSLSEYPLLLIFSVSLIASYAILATSHWHGKYSMDSLAGIQRFHEHLTPRIGGLAVMLALGVGVLILGGEPKQLLKTIFILGFFVFSFGFTEDLTKQVSVPIRLWASFMPAVIAYFLTGTVLREIGWLPFDYLLSFSTFAIIFTAFAVGGLTHAINIIDGFNGLCSWVSIWALLAMMTIALQVGDIALALVIPIIIASILGFLVFNWPFGKIFLGDGGSYLLGVCVAWCSILLATRNSEVSPFALFLICTYPITEVLYSIYRRRKSRKASGQPDRLHLHQLIAMVYIYWGLSWPRSLVLKNSLSGFVISLFTVPPALTAVVFHDRPPMILAAIAFFVVSYCALYQYVLAKAQTLPALSPSEGNQEGARSA